MLWNDVNNNFTWEQLGAFQWGELSLNKYQLLLQSKNASIQLPEDVKKQLHLICNDLLEYFPEKKTFLQALGINTVFDFVCFLNNVANLYNFVNEHALIEKFMAICQSINLYLQSLL